MDAARIELSNKETIQGNLKTPVVTFVKKGSKSYVSIILGFERIADIHDDSTYADPAKYVDAVTNGTNFVSPGVAEVIFERKGTQGDSIMTITAELSTKIPGTGASFRNEARNKRLSKTAKKAPNKTKASSSKRKRI